MGRVTTYLNRESKAAPLAAFRLLFGIMMFLSIARFWGYGWIDKLYIQPTYFFSYYGFEFVKPLGHWTYLIFAICGISSLMVAAGYKYRIAIVTFFLSFTYIELMDKTTYLNHYYFVSLVSFILIFLPAHRFFSIDAWKNPDLRREYVPSWTVDALKLMLGIVYFYAGLAKLNSDWLIEGMPLAIWLPANYDLPLLGDLLHKQWVIYGFSYAGALYDLAIPFLLLYRPTRLPAFVAVVVFHVLTRLLFPIGMFPFIMIVGATIFFDSRFHERFLAYVGRLIRMPIEVYQNNKSLRYSTRGQWRFYLLAVFFSIQLLLPFRHYLYPGELFWTEQGYRFSWRVMLMEKAGYAQFKVVNNTNGEFFYVDNSDFLTSFQEKQMSTQPDFILEYAHYLHNHFNSQGQDNIAVYVESYVALNGRRSQPYIDPTVNLANQRESFNHKPWILPFNDEIKGL